MRTKTESFKIIILLIVFFLFPQTFKAQISRGFVKEGLKIKSSILKREVRYTVYLPFDYESSDRYYPAVYLLHGYTDNDMGWIQFGEANMIADEAIAQREIPPMIIVMPDAGVSWYINNYDNTLRYEDFFVNEFIPFIEKEFRIRAEKRYRAVAGLSMGGYGALVYALKHPDMFSSCIAFSAAVFTDPEIIDMNNDEWQGMLGVPFNRELKGNERITKHFIENDPLYIIKNAKADKLKSVSYYIDCGDDDFLYKGNSALHVLLRDLNIPHEYRVRDGSHQWSYWRSGLTEGLKFAGISFH